MRRDMTEKEKMLSGQLYSAVDPQLLEELGAVKEVIHRYNALSPSDNEGKFSILKDLLGWIGDDAIIVNQPFYCDYGKQIRVGKRFFANFNFTVLDEAPVTIGDDCFIGPNVSIYTACHSTDPVERNSRREWAEPVTIGDNRWQRDHPPRRQHRRQCHGRGRIRRYPGHPFKRRRGRNSLPRHQKTVLTSVRLFVHPIVLLVGNGFQPFV